MENNNHDEKCPPYNPQDTPTYGNPNPYNHPNTPLGNQPVNNQYDTPYGSSYNQPLPPNSNMVWGILTTLLCCLPFGVVSIIYASKVDNLWRCGAFEEARRAAKTARNWAIASAASAFVIWALYLIFVVLLAVLPNI